MNELKYTYAGSVALEASGASAANAAFAAANDAVLSSANHSDFPNADFFLKTVGFGTTLATTGSPVISLYRQDLNVAGEANADAPAPSTASKDKFVGNFILPLGLASTGTNYFPLIDVPLSSSCQFSIENQSGQSLNEGWALTAAPKSFAPGA